MWSTNHGDASTRAYLQSLVANPEKLPFANRKETTYASAKIPKWSKWKADGRDPDLLWKCKAYDDFQTSIRQALKGSNLSPFQWEMDVWIAIANKRTVLKD